MTEGNYSNVGNRGPVYKGLGAMNPCDLSLYTTTVKAMLEKKYRISHLQAQERKEL
jgi:DNA gyrase/topoisomerase IV subunit B